MNFLQEQLKDLSQEGQSYKDHYEADWGPLPRRGLLLHTLSYLVKVKGQLNRLPENDKVLRTEHVMNIKEEDSSSYIAGVISQKYKELVAQKKGALTEEDIFWLVLSTYKSSFLCGFLFFCAESLCRLKFSVLILYLFEAVNSQDTRTAYIFIGIMMVLWYFSQLFKQSGCILTYTMASNIKAGLAMLLYAKISKVTSFVIKSSELGKITNLLSNDLGAIEQRLIAIMTSSSSPVMLVGITIILIIRIGWVGILGVILVVLMFPISSKISEKNGEVIQEINKFKDRRVQITTEVIEGIKYIKLYGWELAFKKIIQDIRNNELESMRKLAVGRAVQRALGNSISFIASIIMFIVASYTDNSLSFTKIFATLEIMTSLRIYALLSMMGMGLYYELKVVFDRFASIFNIEHKSMIELDQSTQKPVGTGPDKASDSKGQKDLEPQLINSIQFLYKPLQKKNERLSSLSQEPFLQRGVINFNHFNGYWKGDYKVPSLKDIHYRFTSGKIYGITGKVGSGKSGLFGAILSEIPYYSGKLEINGSIAYVQQEPIVFSDTVKNNIIFGRQFKRQQYDQSIRLSCMTLDLKILEKGDKTIVGQKGITLSGGQKARLALARAIYGSADIYLLDDPISAVDAKIAKQIFQDCLMPLARNKTVLLVTHQIPYLYSCDEAIILEDGGIAYQGKPQTIKAQLEVLNHVFKPGQQSEEKDEEDEDEACLLPKTEIQQISQSEMSQNLKRSAQNEEIEADKLTSRFLQKNAEVTFGTYARFFFSNKDNYFILPITIFLFLVSEGITTVFYRFLASYDDVNDGTSSFFASSFGRYWGALSALVVSYFIVLTLKYFVLNLSILLANTSIHEMMIEAIVRSPGSFFDTTPSGVLVSKFSNDLGVIDNNLVFAFIDALEGPTMIVVALVNISQINIFFLIPAFVLFSVAVLFFNYSRPVISGCKQLDLQTKNPIFHQYSETISGLTQIRIYNQRSRKLQEFSHIINKNSKASIGFDMVSRGFGFYQTVNSIVLMALGMVLGVVELDGENRALYGVTVIYLITVCDVFQWILRQIITVQSLMVSGERILQFKDLEKEGQLRMPYDKEAGLGQEIQAADKGEDIHQEWPLQPSISVNNLSARYKKGLPLVLKGVSFEVNSGQKVGIVGRTGAGKSSIIQALFRIFQPELGSVYHIGRHNALEMGLHSLRQHISVIPQVPFLFKGTIKQNMDPFDTASEEDLWRVLEESGLNEHVRSLEKKLETDISNNSESFSVGQKQLLCLARALLRRNRILVLDEATSNVDIATDALVQKVIRDRFNDTTVIAIAHRLNTIADYDRVIVMHRGRVVEQGAPFELLERKGLFYDMVQHTGKNAELIRNKARESYKTKNTIAKRI